MTLNMQLESILMYCSFLIFILLIVIYFRKITVKRLDDHQSRLFFYERIFPDQYCKALEFERIHVN